MSLFTPIGCEQVAAYAVFVYDWLLTLETERDLLFQPGVKSVKLAYLFCRYWPLLFQPLTLWVGVPNISLSHCGQLFKIPLIVTAINFAGAASVLLVRLYAFNGRRLASTLALASFMLIVVIYIIYTSATRTKHVPHAPGCVPTDADPNTRFVSGAFLAALLWDMLIMLVFIYYAVVSKIHYTVAGGATRVFLREGLVYFFAIALVQGINVILNWQSNVQIAAFMVPFGMLFPNLLACRLVVNLRKTTGGEAETLPMHTGSGPGGFYLTGFEPPSMMKTIDAPPLSPLLLPPHAITANATTYAFAAPLAHQENQAQLLYSGSTAPVEAMFRISVLGAARRGDILEGIISPPNSPLRLSLSSRISVNQTTLRGMPMNCTSGRTFGIGP